MQPYYTRDYFYIPLSLETHQLHLKKKSLLDGYTKVGLKCAIVYENMSSFCSSVEKLLNFCQSKLLLVCFLLQINIFKCGVSLMRNRLAEGEDSVPGMLSVWSG